MKVKKTNLFKDYARVISTKIISTLDVEDIDEFVKKKEDAVGIGDIAIAIHEIYNKTCHKLTIRYESADSSRIEEMIIYKWED